MSDNEMLAAEGALDFCCRMSVILGSIRERPLKRGTLLNPTSGSLTRDLIERVYIPRGLPNPNSRVIRFAG